MMSDDIYVPIGAVDGCAAIEPVISIDESNSKEPNYFTLICNEGRQDKLLLSCNLLQERLKSINDHKLQKSVAGQPKQIDSDRPTKIKAV